MRILVSGATGLLGSRVSSLLGGEGHEVTALVRSAGREGVLWSASAGIKDLPSAEGFDGVIHLAGENIGEGRWTPEKKARIRESRVDGTRGLVSSLLALKSPPGTLVCASAIGYYGDRGAVAVDESASPGKGFLAGVCREWEEATAPATANGIRVVNLRFGVVLSRDGGALARMLLPFRMGVGGKVGSGRQYMSWIAIGDAVGIIAHALSASALSGPVNAVAPHAVTNAEFTATLARVLFRPAVFPVPAFAARMAFGEMADALLLASTRVTPARLLESGYAFRHPRLEEALRHLLAKAARSG